MYRINYSLSLLFCFFLSCQSPKRLVPATSTAHKNQQVFWEALQQLCGNSYEGALVASAASDTLFKNKVIRMHVRACASDRIRIPLVVGNDLSRTWVFVKTSNGLLLKHNHRHHDGSQDSITRYGGHTTNNGLPTMQFFPAD